MGTLLHGLGTVCAQAADLLVSCAWKGLLLVACMALLLRCLPRLSAGVRSALWTAALLLVLLLPLLSPRGVNGATDGRTVVHADATWALVIAGVWAALSLLRLVQLGASAMRLRVIARRAVPVLGSDMSETVAKLLGRTSLRSRRVMLCVSPDVSRPSVVGFFRPRILLPMGLLEQLSGPELEHVVLHELEHLRRRDDWTNLLQKLSLALFPLHPALLWIDRRLCLERELACDDGVLQVTGAPKAYAACLARLAEDSLLRRGFSLGLSLAMGLLGVRGRRSELTGRVHRILRSPVGMASAMSRRQMAVASALVLCALSGGSLLLARSPQLVSFAPPVSAYGASQAAALADHAREIPTVQSVPAARLAASLSAASPSAAATMVKAVMPNQARKLTPAVASTTRLTRKRTTLQRIAFAQPQRPYSPAPAYVVFTAWQQQVMMPHLTLTVAHSSQNPENPQATYAAVPVRGGWLLIQL